MAKKVEKEKRVARDPREKLESLREIRPETPTSFLEDLMTMVKLRFLKQKLIIEDVDQEKVSKLEQLVQGGTESEKDTAKKSINSLFTKLTKVDNALREDTTISDTLRAGGEKNIDLLAQAGVVEDQLNKFKELGATAKKEEINQTIELVRGLSAELGVDLEGTDKKMVENRLNMEITQLREAKDRASLAKEREMLEELTNDKKGKKSLAMRKEILKTEDFKPDAVRKDEKRVFKVRKSRKQIENQRGVDVAIKNARDDFEGDRLERISEDELLKGYLDWRTQGRRSPDFVEGFGGIDEVEQETLKIASIYAEEYSERVANKFAEKEGITDTEREARKVGAKIMAMGTFQEAWVQNGDLNVKEIQQLFEKNKDLTKMFTEMMGGKVFEQEWMNDPEYVAGLNGRSKGNFWSSKKATALFESNNVSVSELKNMYQAAKDRAAKDGNFDKEPEYFAQFVKRFYREIGDEDIESIRSAFKDFENKEGNHHYGELQEKLKKHDYKGYVKTLITYLYQVGLREGRQDFQLGILMREARTILAENGQKELLEWYENFEKMAMSHEQFMQLDGEGYAKTLNFLTHRPWEVFLDEYADTLSIEVARDKEGKEKMGEFGVWQFQDMLMNESWAERVLYTSTLHEDDVYQEMVATQIFGDGEMCTIDKKNGIILGTKNKIPPKLTDWIYVDGDRVQIKQLLEDGSWMAATAHDLWRYSGNAANVLDDVDFTKALGMNKGLLGVWKIRRYAEQYGFVPPYMFEALGMDNFLYSVENYKGLVAKGMSELVKDRVKIGETIRLNGVEVEVGDLVKKVIHEKFRRLRKIGDTELRSNYISADDVSILARRTPMSFEEAKVEFLNRQKKKGRETNWATLSDSEQADYNTQITNMQIRWNKSMFTSEEWKEIDKIDWKAVNVEYGKRLGKKNIGNLFEDFVKNFSYSRVCAYRTMRATDMKDFGNYYLKSEAVTKVYKSGFYGGATKALVEIFGSIEGFLPYDTSGFRRFAVATMEQVFDWHKKRMTIKEPETNADGDLNGKKTKDGKLVVDEYGHWVPKSIKQRTLWGKSVLQEDRFTIPYTEREVEYATYFLVRQGIIAKSDADKLLDGRYGGLLKNSKYGAMAWRWAKRWLWLDDPAYLAEAAWDDGKKAMSGFFKYIFG